MPSSPYREGATVVGRCGRGHTHDAKAIGAMCCISPCRGTWDGGWDWDTRRIERVEVEGAATTCERHGWQADRSVFKECPTCVYQRREARGEVDFGEDLSAHLVRPLPSR